MREDSLPLRNGRSGCLAAAPEHSDESLWAGIVLAWPRRHVNVVSLSEARRARAPTRNKHGRHPQDCWWFGCTANALNLRQASGWYNFVPRKGCSSSVSW